MTDGSFANKTGRIAEGIIAHILSGRGYTITPQMWIGMSIYNHKMKCDFLLSNVSGFPNGLIIESKWQDGGGSVDEKFPYLTINIKERYPCPTIVVLGGNGWKKGSILWLIEQIDEKLIGVYNIEEFISYVNRKLPPPQS
jgi:hypothetical protein